jgi:chitin deacetylase
VPARYRGKIVRQRVRHFPNRIVALTFDDGPDPVITPQVLATLKRHHSRATFFVLGRNAKRYPQLVKQAAAQGHAIGSHGYTHPQRCTPAQAQSELQRTAAIIRQATGKQPTVFRPPYGITTGNLCRQAQAAGYPAILWTISSADTRPISAATIAKNVIHTPNPGDFVLMHDGAGHKATAQALEQILTELTAAGFQFVTIPELLSAWDRWQARQAQTPVAAKSRP